MQALDEKGTPSSHLPRQQEREKRRGPARIEAAGNVGIGRVMEGDRRHRPWPGAISAASRREKPVVSEAGGQHQMYNTDS